MTEQKRPFPPPKNSPMPDIITQSKPHHQANKPIPVTAQETSSSPEQPSLEAALNPRAGSLPLELEQLVYNGEVTGELNNSEPMPSPSKTRLGSNEAAAKVRDHSAVNESRSLYEQSSRASELYTSSKISPKPNMDYIGRKTEPLAPSRLESPPSGLSLATREDRITSVKKGSHKERVRLEDVPLSTEFSIKKSETPRLSTLQVSGGENRLQLSPPSQAISKISVNTTLSSPETIGCGASKPSRKTKSLLLLQRICSWQKISTCKAIAEAASDGDEKALSKLVTDNPELVDAPLLAAEFTSRKTAFMCAAIGGYIGCMKILKSKGANVLGVDNRGRSSLHLAVAANQVSSTNWILEFHPGSLEVSDTEGSTPLHIAAENNYCDLAQILIAADTSLEAKNCLGRTPLHCATIKGHLNTCTLLLRKSAFANALDIYRLTPLHLAAKLNKPTIVDLLLTEGADCESHALKGRRPIHYAAYFGHLEVLERLCHQLSNLQSTTDSGETPLHLACVKGRFAVAMMLLLNGVEVNPWTTPAPSWPVITSSTVQPRCSVSKVTGLPSTPLHLACAAGQFESTKVLLRHGAWVNTP